MRRREHDYVALSRFAMEVFSIAYKDLNIAVEDHVAFMIDYNLPCNGSTAWDSANKRVCYIALSPYFKAMEVAETIFHECRHLHQGLRKPELLDNTGNADSLNSFEAYYNQPTEVIARMYADMSIEKYKRQIKQLIKKYKLR